MLDDGWREPLRDSDARPPPLLPLPPADLEEEAGRPDPLRLRDVDCPPALLFAALPELFEPVADPRSPAFCRSGRSPALPLWAEAERDEVAREVVERDGVERFDAVVFFAVLEPDALLGDAAAAFFGGAASVASLATFFLLKSGI